MYETLATRLLFLELIGTHWPYLHRDVHKKMENYEKWHTQLVVAQSTVYAKCQAIKHVYRNGNAPNALWPAENDVCNGENIFVRDKRYHEYTFSSSEYYIFI